MLKVTLLLLASLAVCFSAIVTDEVHNLPQYPSNYNFTMYSGLLSLAHSKERQIHYVFVTKAGEKSSVNDAPVILWLNGGPGCSSMLGILFENGPYVIEDGHVNMEKHFNIWSWNQFANIIYFETPAGVGFSPQNGESMTYSDDTTTEDAYAALVSFFKGFPELQSNDFWISGESYGGIYVPFLGAYIAKQNQKEGSLFINLQGIQVVNGVGSYANFAANKIDFLRDHYLITDELYSEYYLKCLSGKSSPDCGRLRDQIDMATEDINPYDIHRYCYTNEHPRDNVKQSSKRGWFNNPWIASLESPDPEVFANSDVGIMGSDVPCIWTGGLHSYLNIQEVKKALNVDTSVKFTPCNRTVGMSYRKDPKGSVPKYRELIEQGYEIQVYSGDTDAVVPWNDSRDWIARMGLGIKEEWRPWYMGDQVGGFVEVYNGITFVTVKGVGHQVPGWARQAGYELMKVLVEGKDLPTHKEKATEKLIEL